jgi:hypothetical protein
LVLALMALMGIGVGSALFAAGAGASTAKRGAVALPPADQRAPDGGADSVAAYWTAERIGVGEAACGQSGWERDWGCAGERQRDRPCRGRRRFRSVVGGGGRVDSRGTEHGECAAAAERVVSGPEPNV